MFSSISDFLLNSDPMSWGMISILIGVGIIVGFVNTLAGMATALSYALFMAMGMPINVANGTARVGVLAQFAVSSHMFKKQGYLDYKLGFKVGIPVAIGSILGAEFAAILNPSIMEIVMGIMLPIMAFLLIYNQNGGTRLKRAIDRGWNAKFGVLEFIVFVFVGIYGGFTHAGVGILIIFGSFYLLGLDILRSNGIKQFAVLMYTPLALTIFILHGQVNWRVALIYAIGNVAGALVASKVAIKWGAKFINYSIAVAVCLMSFWLIYKQF